MKRLIARLRAMSPDDTEYEPTFMELIRDTMHHVADEETTLLPLAERVLADALRPLGMAMTKRRLQLAAPRAGEIIGNQARAFPKTSVLVAAGTLLAGTYLLTRPAAH